MERRKIDTRLASGWLGAGLVVGALLGWFMSTVIQAVAHRTFDGFTGAYIGTGVFFGAALGFALGASMSRAGASGHDLRAAGWTKILIIGAIGGVCGAYLGMEAGILYLHLVPGGDLVWIMFSVMFGVVGALLPALVLAIKAMRRRAAAVK